MKRWVGVVSLVLMPAICFIGRGQVLIQFDAATIKLDQRGPGDAGIKGGPGTTSPGRVTWRKAWLRDLVATAFHVDAQNVSGPDWIAGNNAQLYWLIATMPDDASRHDFNLMLQAFLIEQFKLRIHHEPKMFPSYELIVASGGARLTASADPNAPDAPISPPKVGADGFPVFAGHGARIAHNLGYHGRYQNYSMSEFAEHLINWVTPPGGPTRYVMDKTGLTGVYDFTLKFDDGGVSGVVGSAVHAAMPERDESEPGSGLPSIFKALEQQLGLKLVKEKDIPLDTIVVDHADRMPAGN